MPVAPLPDSVDVVEIAYDSYVNIVCMIVPAVVVVYEHAITFYQEVELLWGRSIKTPTVLFYFNRFVALGYAASTLGNIPYGGSYHLFYARSKVASATWLIFLLLFTITWAAFSALRVYAVGKQAWRLASCVFVLNMMNIAMNLRLLIIEISTSTFPASYGNGLGSLLRCNGSQSISIDVTLAARVCGIMADLIVLGVTWKTTYALWKSARLLNNSVTYATLLLRDGTLYFLILLVLNVVAITTNILSLSLSTPYFVYGFQSVVISRFLLNLRQASHADWSDNLNVSCLRSRAQDARLDNPLVGPSGMGTLLKFGMHAHPQADSPWDIMDSPVPSRVELESVIDLQEPALEHDRDRDLAEDGGVLERARAGNEASDAGAVDAV